MFVIQPLVDLLVAFLPFLPVHPHHPHAITMQGAAGQATVTYFTVPYNAEHLADLDSGFVWHLGFAGFNTEVPLKCGDISIPKASYKLNVIRGEGDDDWSVQLLPFDLYRAEMVFARAKRSGRNVEEASAALDSVKEKLAEAGIAGALTLPTSSYDADSDEHLAMVSIFYGYSTLQRGSTEPRGGMKFDLRFGFGDLHKEVKLEEVYEAPEGAGDGGRRR